MVTMGKPIWKEAATAWQKQLDAYFTGPEYAQLNAILEEESNHGIRIYPPENLRFKALEITPLHSVKCVILGQDPYHKLGQANGLAFSVSPGIPLPPSLRNMLKELNNDAPNQPLLAIENQGDLTCWAQQGVLLLNTLLTVREGQPLSHQHIGWETLVSCVIDAINNHCVGVVFVLWGKSAQFYSSQIDSQRHAVISGVHPSPLSAHRGFFGSKPFSKVNELLVGRGNPPIIW